MTVFCDGAGRCVYEEDLGARLDEVWVVWNEEDYYGPDPADAPWIFLTEAEARARAFELRGPARGLQKDDEPWPYRWERVAVGHIKDTSSPDSAPTLDN